MIQISRLEVGPLGTNCWVVSDGEGGPTVVIDPGGDGERILESIGSASTRAVVLTHAHFDHLGAATQVVAATGAPLMVHEVDAPRVTSGEASGTGGALFGFGDMVAPEPDRLLRDGDAIELGSLVFRVLHTPGHTEGGIALFVDDPAAGAPHLFSGDTLFAGSVGRTDFPGGDSRALSRSIAEKLSPLPGDTVVHPGHGPDTTIGREARVNPFWPRA